MRLPRARIGSQPRWLEPTLSGQNANPVTGAKASDARANVARETGANASGDAPAWRRWWQNFCASEKKSDGAATAAAEWNDDRANGGKGYGGSL
jgi:hypothetical protein